MERHDPTRIRQRLLACAFIAGPALLLSSALSFALGIGLIPPGITSWVEGILGSYALALFVPIYLALALRLCVTHPRLGVTTCITGLLGATCGFSMEFARVTERALRLHGADGALFDKLYSAPGWEYLSVALLGPLFPITSVLLGIGFYQARTLPRWVAVCLMVAGIGFPLAQVGGFDWALRVTYPLACALWLVSLGYVGWVVELGAARAASDVPQSVTRWGVDTQLPLVVRAGQHRA